MYYMYYVCIYIYIYIYMCPTELPRSEPRKSALLPRLPSCPRRPAFPTANLRTKILDFRGFYSSIILTLRGGVLMSIGNLPEVLSQRILAGMI